MPKPKPKRHSTPDRPPSPTELRALSNAALTLELSHMPDAGDPVRIAWKVDGEVPIRIAEQIKAAILGSEHERAYTWLRGHLPKPDKVIDREPNAALAEIEAIRAAAEATADFLQLNTATAAKAHVARLRKMR